MESIKKVKTQGGIEIPPFRTLRSIPYRPVRNAFVVDNVRY
jgi:hypothetical protein